MLNNHEILIDEDEIFLCKNKNWKNITIKNNSEIDLRYDCYCDKKEKLIVEPKSGIINS